jgi:hypothetical protein
MDTITFALGQYIPLSMSFTGTLDGELVDPTTVTLTVRSPTGVSMVYAWPGGTIARTIDGTGITCPVGSLTQEILATEPGLWSYKIRSTGTARGGASGQFTVLPDPF